MGELYNEVSLSKTRIYVINPTFITCLSTRFKTPHK